MVLIAPVKIAVTHSIKHHNGELMVSLTFSLEFHQLQTDL